MRKLAAELVGTFWLVFCGCGSAVLAATQVAGPNGEGERLLIASFVEELQDLPAQFLDLRERVASGP